MRHLILLSITKACYVRITWRSLQKEHIKQVMVWQLRMQHTLGRVYFEEQLFTAICRDKRVYNTPCVLDKGGEWSIWKHVVFMEIEDVSARNLGLNSTERWKSSAVVMVLILSQHQKGKRKFSKLDEKLNRWVPRAIWDSQAAG